MFTSKYAQIVAVISLTGMVSYSEASDCDINSIGQQLAPVQAYEFNQSRTVAALSRPLRSQGVIWLSDNEQLVWQVQNPIKSTTVISADGVREYNRNDELQPVADAAIASDLSDIFLNLLSGNFSALNNAFNSTVDCSDEGWAVELFPQEQPFNELLSTLNMTGNEAIESISWQEVRGDTVEISLEASNTAIDDESIKSYLED